MNRTERWAAMAGYAWLVVVGACVVAMSWTGLLGFATDILGIHGRAAIAVPISLDGAAVTCAFLGLRSVLAGNAAIFPRLLAWMIVAAGAAANYYHAWKVGEGQAAALYFAGMTALVYLLFEVILRQLRHKDLEAKGATEPPLARFRLVRWLRFPIRTFRAWSVAVEHGLTDPAQALTLAGVVLERAADQQQQPQVLDHPETISDQTALEIRETVTRQVTARSSRNGTVAGRVRELVDEGAVTVEDILAVEPTFSRDTVRRTLARIDAERSGS